MYSGPTKQCTGDYQSSLRNWLVNTQPVQTGHALLTNSPSDTQYRCHTTEKQHSYAVKLYVNYCDNTM
jgi:hypothetical protein